ncbi:DUF4492 domain-containing protein [Sulfurimonas sp.]
MSMKNKIILLFNWIYHLYYDGFKHMRVGKTLWVLIAVKLFIMFVIIKWLFFPDLMQENFSTDQQRSQYILNQLTKEN